MKRTGSVLLVFAFLVLLLAPVLAMAAPRSGGSFGGRRGFRPPPRTPNGPTAPAPRGGGGPSFFFFPGFGWGWGGYGAGGSMLGTLAVVAILGVGAVVVMRAVRRSQMRAHGPWGNENEAEDLGRAYVTSLQLGLGRSGREIQARLARFAAEGDTSSEAGLAQLMQQTSLELMRHKDSIRYGAVETSGPMSFTNGETKMNSVALSERSRFQVERVRGSEGQVRRAETASTVSDDVLEYLVVTLVLATRVPLQGLTQLHDREDLDRVLFQLGAVSPETILGLEVIWTPADPDDALTKDDLVAGYPGLHSL